MTDEERTEEATDETIEDLEAPVHEWKDVVGGIPCQLPTKRCSNPTCTSQTYCKPGTHQGCVQPTCDLTLVYVK